MFNRAIGHENEEDLGPLNKVDPGTLEASIESIEAPLRQAHNAIGGGVSRIGLTVGDVPLVAFDQRSKLFLGTTQFDHKLHSAIGRVSVISGIDRSGRVFLPYLGKNVSFSLSEKIDEKSVQLLIWSQNQYVLRKKSRNILVRFNQITGGDGRVKKIVICAVEEAPET